MRLILKILRDCFIFYLALTLLIYFLQRGLIYFPEKISSEAAIKLGNQRGFLPWYDAKGFQIGWKHSFVYEPTAPKYSVLIFHGNAGYALQRAYLFKLFHNSFQKYNWDCYILEYPGYGAREGKPSELTIREAAYHAVESLKLEKPKSLILLGESLGCAVASAVTQKYPEQIKGVVIITPFNNLQTVAQNHYPWLPVRWLLKDKWQSDANLSRYPGPVAFIIAENDEAIPRQFGEKFYEDFPARKKIWIVSGAHNDMSRYSNETKWWQEVLKFLFEK